MTGVQTCAFRSPARESNAVSRFSLDNERAGDDDQRDLVVRDQTLTGTSVAGDVCARTAKMLTLVQDEVGREGI